MGAIKLVPGQNGWTNTSTGELLQTPAQRKQQLLDIIGGGGSYTGGYGFGASPSVNMQAAASSTPVKLMQKFLDSRGWNDAAVGNVAPQQQQSADADRWAAVAELLSGNIKSTMPKVINGGGAIGKLMDKMLANSQAR